MRQIVYIGAEMIVAAKKKLMNTNCEKTLTFESALVSRRLIIRS